MLFAAPSRNANFCHGTAEWALNESFTGLEASEQLSQRFKNDQVIPNQRIRSLKEALIGGIGEHEGEPMAWVVVGTAVSIDWAIGN